MNTEIKSEEEILTKIANEHSYETWGDLMYDTHEYSQIEYTKEAMFIYASQFKQPVQSNVWVSVKDDKPVPATPVLIATKNWIGIGYYNKNFELNLDDEPEWSEENGEYIFEGEITHWMLLPASPNDDEQPIKEVSISEDTVNDAIEFGEWLRTFNALEKKDGFWVLESQISSRELYYHFKLLKNKNYVKKSDGSGELVIEELIEFINALSENCGNNKKQEWYSGLISDIKIAYEQPIKEVPIEDIEIKNKSLIGFAQYLQECFRKVGLLTYPSLCNAIIAWENVIPEQKEVPVNEDVEKAADKIISEYEPRGTYEYSYDNIVPTYDQDTVREMLCNFYEREWQKQQPYKIDKAIAFADWLSGEGYVQYDGAGRWIAPHNSNNVYSTKELYEQYLK